MPLPILAASYPRKQEPHPLCAGRHTDTTLLPPLRCLRYRLPMAVAISHRNRNITAPHAVGGARLVVGGIVRIDGQGCLGKYQGGLLSLCKKNFGFVAEMRQASYKSIAKTTSPSATVAKPRTPTYLVGSIRDSVRPEGTRRACPECTQRGPSAASSPRITPAPPSSPASAGTPPLTPGSTLTRPHCPHSGASATVSPWQSQSRTATGTSRLPMPTGEPASSLAAWSASMDRGASSSIRGGCVPSAKKILDL